MRGSISARGRNDMQYKVLLETVASVVVTVEADSDEEAVDLAFENAPSPAWDWPDLGDWIFAPDEDEKLDRTAYIWTES